MTAPTVTVSVDLFQVVGQGLPNATVVLELTRSDVVQTAYGGGIVPAGRTVVQCDASGHGSAAVFPNDLGTLGTGYRVLVFDQNGVQVMPAAGEPAVSARIPAQDCQLHAVLYTIPPMSQDDADRSVALARAWASQNAGTVDGAEYSAKYYAGQAQTVATQIGDLQAALVQAGTSATAAQAAQTASEAARDASMGYRDQSQGYASDAALAKQGALDAEAATQGIANSLGGYVTDAQAARDAAVLAQGASEAARDASQASATNASASELATSNLKDATQAIYNNAADVLTQTQAARDAAGGFAANAADSAAAAAGQVTAATTIKNQTQDIHDQTLTIAGQAQQSATDALGYRNETQNYAESSAGSALAAETSNQGAAANNAAANAAVSNALALYGGAAALDGAVAEAEGFALTATAQASLASTYALQAASVAQQDLSGAVSQALHRSPNAVVAQCIDDPRLWSDGGAVLERLSGLSYQREALNGTWLGWHSSEMGARCAAAAAAGTLTLAANQMVGGDFSSATGWTVNAGWSIDTVKGVAVHTPGAGTNTQLYKSAGITINKVYAITFTVRDHKAGSVVPQVGAWNTGSVVSAAGTTTQYIAATHANTSSAMVFSASSDFDGSIDDVIVQEVTNLSVLSGVYYGNNGDGKFYRLWRNVVNISESSNAGDYVINEPAVTSSALTGYAGAMHVAQSAANTVTIFPKVTVGSNPPTGVQAVIACVVQMDDLGAPTLGSLATNDFYLALGGNVATTMTVTPLGGNLYLCVGVGTMGGSTSATGIYKSKAGLGTARGFIVTAWHWQYGSAFDGYEAKTGQGGSQSETFRGNKVNYGRTAWIAEAARVVGYAIDEPGCPMWGVWQAGNDYFINTSGGGAITSLAAVNGWLLVGTSTRGFALFEFAKDTGLSGVSAAMRRLLAAGGLAGVRSGLSFPAKLEAANYWTIANTQVNDVDLCVMPDAPCDPVTGLQVPTIAVGTAGGPSVIKTDGTVSNGPTTSVGYIAIDKRGVWWTNGFGQLAYALGNPNQLAATFSAGVITTATVPALLSPGTSALKYAHGRVKAIANTAGITLVLQNEASLAGSLLSYITPTYNTGWSVAAMRMYLASVSAGEVSDALLNTANYATVASFDNVTSGVTASGFTSTGGTTADRVYGAFPTAIGKTYRIVYTLSSISGGQVQAFARPSSDGTGANLASGAALTGNGQADSFVFTATSTTSCVLWTSLAANNFAVTGISFQEVVADRSYKGAGLLVHGTVTKTAVAAGAQLVAFGNFSNTNFLQEAAPSTDLDPATGAVHGTVWATIPTNVSAAGWAVDRSAATGAFYRLGCDATGKIVASISDGTTTRTVTSPAAYNTGTRVKMGFAYTTDGTLTLNVAGHPVATATGTPLVSLSNAAAVLTVGNSRDLNAAWPGDLALLDIGMTVPTAEQSQYEYAQELAMFQPGAQVTLPDAGAVVSMDYDSAIDGLRVASAANESRFNGLQRVSSTPVSAGSIAQIAGRSGIKLIARTGTNAGVDITIPPKNLLEELNKRAQDAARLARLTQALDYTGGFTATTAVGSTALTGVTGLSLPTGATAVGARLSGAGIPAGAYVTAVVGTTVYISAPATAAGTVGVSFIDLILPVGFELDADVFVARLLQYEGSTYDYQRGFDGFRERESFNAGAYPAAGARVRINARRAMQ